MSITVVITNYQRPDNVHSLMEALAQQTIKPTIFVWDNSTTQDFNDSRIDWLIRSSKNARCSPRWWMASHAHTDFVLIHDDDLMPAHSGVLAHTLDSAMKIAPYAVGACGVILRKNRGYWESEHVGLRANRIQADARVDIVKGFYFCCPTVKLRKMHYLELDAEDDIAVSAWLGRGLQQQHRVLFGLQNSLQLLPEGAEARKQRVNHRVVRDTARWKYFPNR